MNTINKIVQEAIKNEEVRAAARTLAKYGLGICAPHMHDVDTGAILPLPAGMVSCERDLKVSFERGADAEKGTVPVAWRWSAGGLEVCSSCCSAGGPQK